MYAKSEVKIKGVTVSDKTCHVSMSRPRSEDRAQKEFKKIVLTLALEGLQP